MEVTLTLQAILSKSQRKHCDCSCQRRAGGCVCVYLTHTHVCVQWNMPGLVPPYAVYLRRGSHWIIGSRKQWLSKELNVLVKMNRCTQQISLTLIIKFIMLSYQLHYRSYSPLPFTQEKRPGISWPTLIKTAVCKFKEAHVTKLLFEKHCLQLRSPALMALKLFRTINTQQMLTLMQAWSLSICFCAVTSSSYADHQYCCLKRLG